MKKVSICIVTYNQDLYIKDTIESCLNQTYENFEICISDDCSTDKTYDIILEYQKRFPDKIFSHRQNKNVWSTSIQINFNSALSLCTGDFIALLDGDDIMLPDRIKKQVAFLEQNPEYIWVSWWVEAFDSKTWKILWNIHNDLRVKNRTTESLIMYWNSIPPCLLYRKVDSLSACTRLTIMWDWLFYIELSMFWKIWHLDEYLWRYRIHENNSIKKDLYLDYIITLDIIDHKYNFDYFKYTNFARVHYFMKKAKGLFKNNFLWAIVIFIHTIKLKPSIILTKPLKKCIFYLEEFF